MNTVDGDNREWFLRISNGVVFGPVPTQKLCQWTEQGRVQPENDVSEDRIQWLPAQEVPELDFNWFLEDSDGVLTGPFNKRVAERLLSDGRVGEGTSMLPREQADLSKLKHMGEDHHHAPLDDHPEFDLETPVENDLNVSADDAASEWAAEREEFRLRLDEAEREKKRILSAAEKDRKAAERSQTAALKKLQDRLDEASRLREEAEQRCKEAENARSAGESDAAEKSAALEKRIVELSGELDAKKRSLEESLRLRAQDAEEGVKAREQAVSDACEPLLKRIAALESDLRNASDAAPDPKQSEGMLEDAITPFKARITALESELAKAQERVAASDGKRDEAVALAVKPLQARITELETAYDQAAAAGREAVDSAVADATAGLKAELAQKERELVKAQAELETSTMMSDSLSARAAADAAEPLQDQVASLLARLALAEKRADEAVAYRVDTEQAVSNATAPLYVRIDELETEAAATAERTRQAVEAATADLREEREALRRQCDEISASRQELEQKNAALTGDRAAAEELQAKLEAEISVAREKADAMARECASVKSSYSELLSFSNQRDGEANAQLEKARKTIEDLTDENEELKKSVEQQDKSHLVPVLAGLSDRDSQALERIVTSEREFLNGLRDEWQKQQRVVQERLAELARLHGGELAGSAKRQARQRAEQSEINRANQLLESLRHEYAEAMKRSEQRERDLNQQIRKLETENNRAKDMAADSDDLRQRVNQLNEMLHDRDQTLAKERQDRSIERSRYEQAQQALSQRVATLQDGGVRLPFAPSPAKDPPDVDSARGPETEARAAARKSFHVPPWMQLKK